MVIELAAGAAGLVVVVAAGGVAHRVSRGRNARAEQPEEPRSNPTWRLLESEQEVRQAIERAIAYEQAAMALSEQRARRFAAMRADLGPVAAPVGLPADDPSRRRVRPERVSRAS